MEKVMTLSELETEFDRTAQCKFAVEMIMRVRNKSYKGIVRDRKSALEYGKKMMELKSVAKIQHNAELTSTWER